MPYHIRVADGFMKQSAEQLVITAGAIITGLTNNPAFPAPTVDLKAVQDAADELNAALAAQAHGGTAATAEKRNKQEALIVLLRKLKHYVEDNCGNDMAVLLSSGFQAASITRTRSPLANPAILGVDSGNSTELVLKVGAIARAKCYEVRSAAMGSGNVPGSWQTAGLFTNSRGMTIAGLVPGTTYVFQVRAVGGSTGYSDWSNPVSRMCA
jgi:Fibronectin type III domain